MKYIDSEVDSKLDIEFKTYNWYMMTFLIIFVVIISMYMLYYDISTTSKIIVYLSILLSYAFLFKSGMVKFTVHNSKLSIHKKTMQHCHIDDCKLIDLKFTVILVLKDHIPRVVAQKDVMTFQQYFEK